MLVAPAIVRNERHTIACTSTTSERQPHTARSPFNVRTTYFTSGTQRYLAFRKQPFGLDEVTITTITMARIIPFTSRNVHTFFREEATRSGIANRRNGSLTNFLVMHRLGGDSLARIHPSLRCRRQGT